MSNPSKYKHLITNQNKHFNPTFPHKIFFEGDFNYYLMKAQEDIFIWFWYNVVLYFFRSSQFRGSTASNNIRSNLKNFSCRFYKILLNAAVPPWNWLDPFFFFEANIYYRDFTLKKNIDAFKMCIIYKKKGFSLVQKI